MMSISAVTAIHAIIDYKQTGRIKLTHINGLNNRQSERYNRMKASQWESERGALHQQNRALELKAESEHKTVVILIIGIIALLAVAGAFWIIITRRQRERENEERIEALQKMVDEYKSAPSSQKSEINDSSALRNVMLKQLGKFFVKSHQSMAKPTGNSSTGRMSIR